MKVSRRCNTDQHGCTASTRVHESVRVCVWKGKRKATSVLVVTVLAYEAAPHDAGPWPLLACMPPPPPLRPNHVPSRAVTQSVVRRHGGGWQQARPAQVTGSPYTWPPRTSRCGCPARLAAPVPPPPPSQPQSSTLLSSPLGRVVACCVKLRLLPTPPPPPFPPFRVGAHVLRVFKPRPSPPLCVCSDVPASHARLHHSGGRPHPSTHEHCGGSTGSFSPLHVPAVSVRAAVRHRGRTDFPPSPSPLPQYHPHSCPHPPHSLAPSLRRPARRAADTTANVELLVTDANRERHRPGQAP